MQIIKELSGASSSKVELVSIEGRLWVLKTADPVEIENEKAFYTAISDRGLPTLEQPGLHLPNNQILLEYIDDSPTLQGSLYGEEVERWGAQVKALHEITSPEPAILDGELHKIDWSNFIAGEIEGAVHRQKAKKGLGSEEINQFLPRVEILKDHVPVKYSLLHADLHSNNVLLRDEELVFFDKGSGIFYGDPWYDLATVALEFPIETVINNTKGSLWGSFCDGYRMNPAVHPSFISYILLRAVSRYPNQFLPNGKSVIEYLLK